VVVNKDAPGHVMDICCTLSDLEMCMGGPSPEATLNQSGVLFPPALFAVRGHEDNRHTALIPGAAE
jgi:hypothetical protein